MMTNTAEAINLPVIMSRLDTGRVNNNSKEPVLNSSENNRIVIAGMINEKVIGRSEKKFLISACPNRKNVEKKNHPVKIRNIDMTIYAIGEIK